MAFDVLNRIFTNVQDIRKDIEKIRVDSNKLAEEQLKRLAILERAQQQADAKRAASARHLQSLSSAEEKTSRALARLEKDLANQREGYARKRNFGEEATKKALAGQIPWIEAATRKTRDQITLVERSLQLLKARRPLLEDEVRSYEAQLVHLQRIQRTAQVNYQAQQRANTNQQQQLRFQQAQVRGTQSNIIGLGAGLAATGIRPLQALSAPLLSLGFGGPVSGALATLGPLLSGIVAISETWLGVLKNITTTGFEFYSNMEQSRLALSGVLAQSTKLQDAQGNLLTGANAYNAAVAIASNLQDKLVGKVLFTNLTLEEGNQALQTGLGFLTARGVQAEDALEIIVRLTAAAKALGLEGGRAAFQVRSVLSGISSRSILASQLESAGTDIRKLATMTGEEATAAYLAATDQLARGIQATSATVRVQLINVADAIRFILGKAFGDVASEAAPVVTSILSRFLNQRTGELTQEGQRLREAAADFYRGLVEFAQQVITPDNINVLTTALSNAVTVSRELLDVFTKISAFVFPTSVLSVLTEMRDQLEFSRANLPGMNLLEKTTARLMDEGSDKRTAFRLFGDARAMGLSEADATRVVEQFLKDIEKAATKVSTPGKFGALAGKTFGFLDEASRRRILDQANDFILELKNIQAAAIQPTATQKPADFVVTLTKEQLKDTAQLVKLQEALAKLRSVEGTELTGLVNIGGKRLTVEQGILAVEKAIEVIQNKLAIEQRQKDRLEQAQTEEKHSRLRIAALDEEIALAQQLFEITKDQADAEEREAISLRTRLVGRARRADQAVEEARAVVQERKAKLAVTDDPVLRQEAFNKVLDAEIDLREALRNRIETNADSLQQLSQRYDQITNSQKVYQTQLREELATLDVQKNRALGISGVAEAYAALNQELQQNEIRLNRQQKAIDRDIAGLRGIADAVKRLNLDTKLGEFAQEGVADLTGLKNEIEEARNRYREIVDLQLRMQQFTADQERLEDQRSNVLAEIAEAQSEEAAGLRTSLSLYFDILAANNELLDIEERRQRAIEAHIERLELEKQILIQRGVAGDPQALIAAQGIAREQQNLRVQITRSRTEANKLRDPFLQLVPAINRATGALADFFDTIELDLVADLAEGIGSLSGGLQDLLGKREGKNFFQQMGDVFTSKKKGGGGGAVGTVLGGLEVASQVASVAGPIAQGIMSVVNIFGSIFSKAAREMAKSISENIDDINRAYTSGQKSLIQTMTALEQERVRTFALQQKKGGEEEAKKLRREIDDQIASLREQQKEILETFRFDLALQGLGAGFQDLAKLIKDAGERIKEFVGAGGTVGEAQRYLNNILAEYRDTLGEQVSEQQQQALERAQQLIDLQQDLSDLELQHAQNVAGILSQGLVQRQLTFGQQKAQQLANENNQYDKQRKQLEDQLSQTRALLDIDRQILDSSIDLNDAEAIRLSLMNMQLAARQKEIDLAREQMSIVQGLIQDQSGNFVLSPELWERLQAAGVFGGTGINVGAVSITIQVAGQDVTGIQLTPQLKQQVIDVVQGLLTTSDELLGRNSPYTLP